VDDAGTIKHGRERAKAWVYSVINPLLEGLKIEASFLSRGNWTFRHHNGDLEFIRPAASYVDFQSRPNWEDFVASNPLAKQELDARDLRREELRHRCEAALNYLDHVAEFRHRVSDCLSRYKADSPAAYFPGGAVPEDKFYGFVAARLINNTHDVPEHYSDHAFWARFRDDLMQFRKGEVFERADEAGRELEKSNTDLSAELAKVRRDLATKYDIPWAPYREESLAVPDR
jgi:hypothetical protein